MRKRIDPLIRFKMPILQKPFNISDEELEFQSMAGTPLKSMWVLAMNNIPDATTITFFRERLREAEVIEELFKMLKAFHRSRGHEDHGGQIIDETLVPVPKQRNTREKNNKIKAGRLTGA